MKDLNLVKDAQQKEVNILSDGSSLISQRKLAALLGVSQSAISQFCLSRKIDTKEGVNEDSASLLITHYALDAKTSTQQ